MKPAGVIEPRRSSHEGEALESFNTSFGIEAADTFPNLSHSSTPARAHFTPAILATARTNFKTRSGKRSLFPPLPAAIPLLGILLIWSVCAAARFKEQPATAAQRRLSDSRGGIDDEEQYILEECLELEADLGIIRPQAASPSDADRSRRIAELVSLLSSAAAEYELKQGVQQAPVEDATFNEVPDSAQASIGAGILSRGCRSGEGSGGAKQDLEPLEGYASGVSSELKPDEWIEEKTDNQYEHSETRGGALSFGIVSVPQRGEASGVVSLVSANPQLPAPRKALYSSKDPCNHPYVRLPALEAGVTLQDFGPSGVFSPPPKSASFIDILLELRRLFAQQTLNQEDANLLVKLVKELASIVWIRTTESSRQLRPLYAIANLGSTFLAMDYLVSAIELLRGHLEVGLWWDPFVSALDTDYSLPAPSQFCRTAVKFNTLLANKLLNALRIYKTRKRPPIQDIVDLKHSLFFSPHSPPLFQDSRWDPWRQDEVLFAGRGYEWRWRF